jgi:nucleolar protein 58
MKLLFCIQISDRIIGLACVLYDCDGNDKVHSASLRDGGSILEDVSGINTRGWSPMKLATALKMVCYPGDEFVVDPAEVNHNIL